MMRDQQRSPADASDGAAVPIHVHRENASPRVPGVRLRRGESRADRESRVNGDAARVTRALADQVRETLAQQQALEAIAERLEASASDAVHRVLHARLSPRVYEVLRTANGESAVAAATNLLDDRLSSAVERAVVETLRDRVTELLRERLDPALGAAIGRSNEDVALDAGAELALELRRAVELGVRDRLREGFGATIRARVHDVARGRVTETVRFAATEAHSEDGNRYAAATAAVVEAAVHDSIAAALGDRIRGIVNNSLYETLGARLDEGLRSPWRAVRTPPIEERRDGNGARAINLDERRSRDERFAERVRPFIADAVRDELTSALRERLDSAARRAVDDTLRDRLAPAIRSAVADQRRWEGIDLQRFGDTVRRQLSDALRTRLNEALRAESMELLRGHLELAVQLGVSRGTRTT